MVISNQRQAELAISRKQEVIEAVRQSLAAVRGELLRALHAPTVDAYSDLLTDTVREAVLPLLSVHPDHVDSEGATYWADHKRELAELLRERRDQREALAEQDSAEEPEDRGLPGGVLASELSNAERVRLEEEEQDQGVAGSTCVYPYSTESTAARQGSATEYEYRQGRDEQEVPFR